MTELLIRGINKGNIKGCGVVLNGEYLVADTTLKLLNELQYAGLGTSKVSIDAPYQHVTWASVHEAQAFAVANMQGIVLEPADNCFSTDFYFLEVAIVEALGGVDTKCWHRPGSIIPSFRGSNFMDENAGV